MAYIRKVQRKQGIRYRVEIHQKDDRTISRSFRIRADADAWARSMEDKKAAQGTTGVVRVRITLKDYFAQWLEEYASANHSPGWRLSEVQMFRDHVEPRLGSKRLDEVSPQDIRALISGVIRQGLSPALANRIRQMLNKIFGEAQRTSRYIYQNPVAEVRPLKEPRKQRVVLGRDEAEALIRWSQGQEMGIGIELALGLALREGEITALQWQNVDLNRNALVVAGTYLKKTREIQAYPKSKQPRILALPAGLRDRLQRLKERRNPHPTDFVVGPEGELVKPNVLIHLLKKGIKENGIGKVTFHGLRHSFAGLYLEHPEADAHSLRAILGHSALATTQRYLHHSERHFAKSKLLDLYSAQTPPKEERGHLRLVVEGA